MALRSLCLTTLLFLTLCAAPLCAQDAARTDDDGRVDLATDKGLLFLAGTQLPDGSWPTECGRSPGITAVAVLAFMAKGHVPGQGPYGENIERGIRYVLSEAQDNGLLAARSSKGGPMYNHGMSTLMLSQAIGMCDDELSARVRPVLVNAIKLTLQAQQIEKREAAQKGGWRYDPRSNDSDISCTGWQLLSLRAAKNCGADVPKAAIDDAVEYVKRSAVKGGGFAYQPGSGGSNRARAATGILSLEICSRHEEPEALAAADFLLANPPKWDPKQHDFFYYSAYYCSQAMFQMGGRYWEIERPRMEALLLSVQNPDGSWPPADEGEKLGGPAYYTAMAVLSLSVKYHYLPIFQR